MYIDIVCFSWTAGTDRCDCYATEQSLLKIELDWNEILNENIHMFFTKFLLEWNGIHCTMIDHVHNRKS